MGLRILYDEKNNNACLFCSTVDVAFGPVAYGDKNLTSYEQMLCFIKWLKEDARLLSEKELQRKWSEFLNSLEIET